MSRNWPIVFLAHAERLMQGLDQPVDRETILALEPLPHAVLDEAACEEAYLAIADMIDMRMPFTFGHSRAVAALADAAGKHLGLPASDIRELRWAAYTHDIGELAVPVSTWMRAGPLTDARDRRGAAASLSWRARAGVVGRRRQAGGGAGAAPSRAARRQRLSPLRQGARPFAGGPHSRRRRSLPDRPGSAAAPCRAERCGRRRKAPQRRQGRKALPARPSRRCSLAPGSPPAGIRASAWPD